MTQILLPTSLPSIGKPSSLSSNSRTSASVFLPSVPPSLKVSFVFPLARFLPLQVLVAGSGFLPRSDAFRHERSSSFTYCYQEGLHSFIRCCCVLLVRCSIVDSSSISVECSNKSSRLVPHRPSAAFGNLPSSYLREVSALGLCLSSLLVPLQGSGIDAARGFLHPGVRHERSS